MNYAIQFESVFTAYLSVSPRRKSLKHSFLRVTEGIILVKLGKKEYAIQEGEGFWIPADCLVSYTMLPSTRYQKVDFSLRLNDAFKQKAGYVLCSELITQSLNKLSEAQIHTEYRNSLLQVLRFESLNFLPALKESGLNANFNSWSIDNKGELGEEINMVLKVREARKRVLSGEKKEHVAQTLFNTDISGLAQIAEHLLGTPL